MNCIQLIGRLTKDPELKFTPNGKKVCTFGIAVQRNFKNKETGQYDADFFNICAWEARAEFVDRYFRKGQRIGITGTMQTRNYVDKNGNTATWYEVIAEGVDFADGKQQNGGAADNAPPPAEPPASYPSQPAPSAAPPANPPQDPPAPPDNGGFASADSDDGYPF